MNAFLPGQCTARPERPVSSTSLAEHRSVRHDGGEERLGGQQPELSESTRGELTLLFTSSSPKGRLP